MTQASGIYKITSIIKPERVYIGSSKSLNKRRTCHFSSMRRNSHKNIKIQRHANKYGVDDLFFEVIEECPIESLEDREQYYIDTLRPYFNLDPYARRAKGRKLSQKHIKAIIESGNKPIYQYGLDGDFIKEWVSGVEAARFYNVNAACLSNACSGVKKKIKGFQWKRYYKDEIDSVKKPIIAQYSLSGEFIKTWASVTEIVKKEKYDGSCINKCLNGVHHRAYGYLWKAFSRDVPTKISPYVDNVKRPVCQYTTEGNMLFVWESVTAAANGTNTNISTLSGVLNGKCQTAGGYVWEFALQPQNSPTETLSPPDGSAVPQEQTMA